MRRPIPQLSLWEFCLGVLVAFVISLSSFAAIQWPECSEVFHINPPGENSHYLTYGLGALWMTDTVEDKIWRIDPSTGTVQDSLDSSWGGGIAFDGAYLWKALYSGPTIRCIRPSDGATVGEIPGIGTEQAGLAWDGTYLWIADRSTQRICKLNPTTGAQISSFDSPGPNPRGLVWWDGYLYHSDSYEDLLYQIDPATGEVISQIGAPTGASRGLTYDGTALWFSDWTNGIRRLVIEVDPAGQVIRSNPFLMLVEIAHEITNTGAGTIQDLQAHWAVPMSDTGHELIDLEYDHQPVEYVYDEFGQQIACFAFSPLEPGHTQQVACTAYERLWHVNYQIDPSAVGPLTSIPQDVSDLYLADAAFLNITHPEIISAAAEATSGSINAYLMARGIHDYVAESLTYESPTDVPWNAVDILREGRGDCTDYTVLFMALGRAVGLPTREVMAAHYTGPDTGGRHFWPEAYIPNYGWIPFDPTRDDWDPPRHRYLEYAAPEVVILSRNGGTGEQYLGFWPLSWDMGGGWYHTSHLYDGKSPLHISNVSAVTGLEPCSIRITWMNPIAPDLSTVLMKRKQGSYPASRSDGVTVYEDTSPIPEAPVACTDTGLTPGATYYYAVFTQSTTGIWRGVAEEGGNADSAVASSSETSAVFRVDSSGNAFGDGTFHADRFLVGSADIAEWVTVSEPVEPGDVLELDPNLFAAYRLSQTACSPLVAGVVSTRPGVVLRGDLEVGSSALLALTGIVPVRVTNEGGPIQPGDLLVASSTPGHAMRWSGDGPCPCALVGKALEPMTDQTGMILVLLTAH